MNTKFLFGFLLGTLFLTSCSSEDEEVETPEVNYGVSFYSQPPYANKVQGHWYDGTFIRCTPSTRMPYVLFVQTFDEQGCQALSNIVEMSNSPIQSISSLMDGMIMGDKIDLGSYFVTTNKYFESPLFYVSTSYTDNQRVGNQKGSLEWFCREILVMPKENASIENIAADYADKMSLDENRSYDGVYRLYYTFVTRLKNSYEVLQLASEINQRSDVSWAEPNLFGSVNYDYD